MTQEQKDKISQVIADLKNEMPEQVDLADLYCAEPFMGSCYGWDDSLGYALDNAIKLFEELRDQPGETCTVEPPKSAQLDENGLMPCGCGGRPTFHHAYVARDDECYLECTACGASGALRLGEERARYSWNTAMGWREDK